MLRRNGRLVGYLLVLAMVLATLWYFQRAAKPPQQVDTMRDLPPLGQPPTPEQIHGSGPPPPPAKK